MASVDDLAALAPLFDAYRQLCGLAADPVLSRDYLAARLDRAESLVLLAEDAAGQATGLCRMYPTLDSLLAAPLRAVPHLRQAALAPTRSRRR